MANADRITALQQLLPQVDPRGRKNASAEDKRTWYRGYDELEKLMNDDEAFEDFIDTLD